MKDKLYISVVNFKSSTLSEAGQVLQRYLDLGIDPIQIFWYQFSTVPDYYLNILMNILSILMFIIFMMRMVMRFMAGM